MHGDRVAHSPACRRHLVTADCPVDCLAPLLPSRVVGRLARADGRRGEAVASCGAPATVGDVVRLYRQGRLGEIAGLGARGITEIEAGLVFAGLLLDASPPPRQPRTRRTATAAPAAAGVKPPAAPGSRMRRPGHGPG
jgi:hypothetical protein